jgi:hypothetical protein
MNKSFKIIQANLNEIINYIELSPSTNRDEIVVLSVTLAGLALDIAGAHLKMIKGTTVENFELLKYYVNNLQSEVPEFQPKQNKMEQN